MTLLGIAWIPKSWNSRSCGVVWESLGFPGSGISGIVANEEREFWELMDAGKEGGSGNSGRDLGGI